MKWLCVKSESSCEYKSETGECTISEEVLIEEGGCPYRVFEKIKNEEGVKEMLKHKSDCAVHNEPAYPKGECDCGILTEKEKQNIKLEVLAKFMMDWLRENGDPHSLIIVEQNSCRLYKGERGIPLPL